MCIYICAYTNLSLSLSFSIYIYIQPCEKCYVSLGMAAGQASNQASKQPCLSNSKSNSGAEDGVKLKVPPNVGASRGHQPIFVLTARCSLRTPNIGGVFNFTATPGTMTARLTSARVGF